jgi:hypothetical protein
LQKNLDKSKILFQVDDSDGAKKNTGKLVAGKGMKQIQRLVQSEIHAFQIYEGCYDSIVN